MLLSVEETLAYEPCTNIYQNRSLFFTFFFFLGYETEHPPIRKRERHPRALRGGEFCGQVGIAPNE